MYKLEGLDPRTKLIMIIAVSTAAMAVDNILMLTGLLAFTVAMLLAGGVEPGRQLKQARVAFGMVAFLFVLQALFGRWLIGAMLCIRLLIIIMSALILMTGQVRDYLLGLVQMKVPYEIAYMVMVGLHFFPILKEEALDVYYSIQLRGTEMKKTSVKNRLRAYMRICLPVLAGAMSRARDMSASMEARAFRSRPRRTYMRKLHLRKRDLAVMMIFPALAAGFIAGGRVLQTDDPALAAASLKNVPQQIVLSWTGNTRTTQTVSWTDTEKSAEYVRYDTKQRWRSRGDFTRSVKAAVTVVRRGEFYRYSAELTGLKPGIKYCYAVGAGKKWSRRESFLTAGKNSHSLAAVLNISRSRNEFSFLSMGDVQYSLRERDYEKWGRVLDRAYKKNKNIRFALMMGDMVEKNADMDDWNTFLDATQNVFTRIPMMTTAGNHETSIVPYTYRQIMALPENGPGSLSKGGSGSIAGSTSKNNSESASKNGVKSSAGNLSKNISGSSTGSSSKSISESDSENLDEEFYSFDYGNCHFVSLNSNLFLDERKNALGTGKWQAAVKKTNSWLEKDLAASKARWKIVFMHHPAYPVSDDGNPAYALIRKNWVPIFERTGVQLVDCGHQHMYMRTKPLGGVTYMMADSGYKPTHYYHEGQSVPDYAAKISLAESTYEIYSVTGNSLKVKAVDDRGNVVDRFTLK